MLLKTYIRSYLQIPVIQGIGLLHGKSNQRAFLFKSNQLLSIEDKILLQLEEYQARNPNAQEFILPSINQWIYICSIHQATKFITISLKENQVIKNFRAQQIQQKLSEDVDLSFQLFESLKHELNDLDKNSKRFESNYSPIASPELSGDVIQVRQVLEALNELSLYVSGFIGPRIVSNFWNMAKPNHSYMARYHLKHDGKILFQGDVSSYVSPLEILVVRQWTHHFSEKCDEVIKDLPKRIEQAGLMNKYRKFISIYTAAYLRSNSYVEIEEDKSLFGDVFEFD